MAGSELTIKVSETKVTETISKMDTKIREMKGTYDTLKKHRESLEELYKGPGADIAIGGIKEREAQVDNAIQRFENQKEKLQSYLDKMNANEAKIVQSYEENRRLAENIFK